MGPGAVYSKVCARAITNCAVGPTVDQCKSNSARSQTLSRPPVIDLHCSTLLCDADLAPMPMALALALIVRECECTQVSGFTPL